jgi:hypothetical protein
VINCIFNEGDGVEYSIQVQCVDVCVELWHSIHYFSSVNFIKLMEMFVLKDIGLDSKHTSETPGRNHSVNKELPQAPYENGSSDKTKYLVVEPEHCPFPRGFLAKILCTYTVSSI